VKLSQIKGVSAAGARRRNAEHSERTPNTIVILSEAKDPCK